MTWPVEPSVPATLLAPATIMEEGVICTLLPTVRNWVTSPVILEYILQSKELVLASKFFLTLVSWISEVSCWDVQRRGIRERKSYDVLR